MGVGKRVGFSRVRLRVGGESSASRILGDAKAWWADETLGQETLMAPPQMRMEPVEFRVGVRQRDDRD